MQKETTVRIDLLEADTVGAGADGKLVTLARSMNVPIMTNDYGLNRVAELQGITVLNVNDLAKAVRPVVLPTDELNVRVSQEGREPGQGVASRRRQMVVVEGGSVIDSEVTVTSAVCDSGGDDLRATEGEHRTCADRECDISASRPSPSSPWSGTRAEWTRAGDSGQARPRMVARIRPQGRCSKRDRSGAVNLVVQRSGRARAGGARNRGATRDRVFGAA